MRACTHITFYCTSLRVYDDFNLSLTLLHINNIISPISNADLPIYKYHRHIFPLISSLSIAVHLLIDNNIYIYIINNNDDDNNNNYMEILSIIQLFCSCSHVS